MHPENDISISNATPEVLKRFSIYAAVLDKFQIISPAIVPAEDHSPLPISPSVISQENHPIIPANIITIEKNCTGSFLKV